MSQFITFGEIMMRVGPPGFLRLRQALPGVLNVTFGGAEENHVTIDLDGDALTKVDVGDADGQRVVALDRLPGGTEALAGERDHPWFGDGLEQFANDGGFQSSRESGEVSHPHYGSHDHHLPSPSR